MKNRMKKIILSFTLLSLFLIQLHAQSMKEYPVYDGADILTEEEEDELVAKIFSVKEKYSGTIGLYIVTINSIKEYGFTNIESCAEAWYKKNNLGEGSDCSGILLFMSMQDRDYDVCAYGAFSHTAFTDYGKQKLMEGPKSKFRNDDWYGGYVKYIETADYMIMRANENNPVDINSDMPSDFREYIPISLVIAFSLSFIIGLVTALVQKAKLNNVHTASNADSYIKMNDIRILTRSDMFTHNTVIRTPINQNNNSGNKSGGGGTHINSGGFSHSSGKF